ncbi:MAG: metalloprotease PmbA [Nitrosomonadaceae bacterium]
MHSPSFSYPIDTLKQITNDILCCAKKGGASSCETDVSEGFGQNVTVRKSEVETIEYNRDKGLSVTVYIGHKRGHASTSDFSKQAVNDAVAAALSIAKHTAEDDCAGLADTNLLAQKFPDLDLYYPWNLSIDEAIQLARTCEDSAFVVDKRIINSEGDCISISESQFIYENSSGFMGVYPTSRHSISCAVIAGHSDTMQRDYWYSLARDADDLESAEFVGKRAGMRSAARLGARKLATCEAPVLFEAPVASGLIGHFISAISGASLYRKSSFLLDSIGKKVFSPDIQIHELPHIKKGLASSVFDDEGVSTHERKIIDNGIVQGYFLGSYSARKLGLCTSGNSGGNHNITISNSTPLEFSAILKEMDKGLLVTELLGQGVNPVTGDYSRGAAGYWVEGGEICYPVEEITIAGNLKDMLGNISAIGNDIVVHGSKQCGSLLVKQMTVAGG